jgi:hypothetical protein
MSSMSRGYPVCGDHRSQHPLLHGVRERARTAPPPPPRGSGQRSQGRGRQPPRGPEPPPRRGHGRRHGHDERGHGLREPPRPARLLRHRYTVPSRPGRRPPPRPLPRPSLAASAARPRARARLPPSSSRATPCTSPPIRDAVRVPERRGAGRSRPLAGTHCISVMLICDPKPAPSRSAYRTGYGPPRDRLSGPSSGSTSWKFGTGGTIPVSSALIAITSSMPDAHRVPREPLRVGDHDPRRVLAEHLPQRVDLRRGAAAARRRVRLVRDEHQRARHLLARRPRASACARAPPSPRRCAPRRAASRGRRCSPSSSPSTRQIGTSPRSAAASALSTTIAAAPMPSNIPCRRRSNGSAARSTTSSVAAAPVRGSPRPSTRAGVARDVVARDDHHTTAAARRGSSPRPATPPAWCSRTPSSSCVLGPRAPIISANCECPMARMRNRKRRSNA